MDRNLWIGGPFVERAEKPKQKIIFVSGIRTTPAEASQNQNAVEEFLKRPIDLFQNATDGVLGDTLESFWGRWFFWLRHTKLAKKLNAQITESITQGERVVLIGHSQGTLITNNAVRMLSLSQRKNVRVIWFAPVVRFPIKGVTIERWRNDHDLIVNALSRPWARRVGREYIRTGAGHNFRDDYLKQITAFPGHQNSNFWGLKKKTLEGHND